MKNAYLLLNARRALDQFANEAHQLGTEKKEIVLMNYLTILSCNL
jgi:hypothetical protein